MRERVEKIAPVRGIAPVRSVSYNVTHSYEEQRGYPDDSKRRGFRNMLRQAMEAHKPLFSSAPQDVPSSEPYSLDISRATHSL